MQKLNISWKKVTEEITVISFSQALQCQCDIEVLYVHGVEVFAKTK